MGLVLEVAEATGPWRWRWLLRDEDGGETLASHQVELDPASDEVARFRDVYGYARWHAAPDRRTADEARIVAEAGAWAGRVLLGEAVGAAIAAAAPVTVRVTVPGPDQAGPDHVGPNWRGRRRRCWGGRWSWRTWMACRWRRGGTCRWSTTSARAVRTGRRPRWRGRCGCSRCSPSRPRSSVLALRRERYALGRLIRRIAARERAAVELRVVQYGVTRQRLSGDRRLPGRVGRAAPVRARRPAGCSCWSTRTGRRIWWRRPTW